MPIVSAAELLARVAPEFWLELSPKDRAVALWDWSLWLRPEQRIPDTDWRSLGFIAGRGWGKTFPIAIEINRRVERGECTAPALMAPTDDRVRDVQVATIVATSPPWFRAEAYAGGVRWPNSVTALPFTARAPGGPRGGNFDVCWLTELVDWNSTTCREAHDNITTATRVGKAQILYDTTSKGKNEVIAFRLAEHRADPERHILRRGTLFDNPYLARSYIRDEVRKYVRGSRRYREEILGEVFEESAGALWQQTWIDRHRVLLAPKLDLTLLALDPSLSDHPDSDECGIVVVGRADRDFYVTADHSARMSPEVWGPLVVELCVRHECAGIVLERNHAGDMPRGLIRVHAQTHGLRVEVLSDREPFPRTRVPGKLFVRERVASQTKQHRSEAPAALYKAGRVHHVGRELGRLELEQTTWEPEHGAKSPNRLDALCYAIAELAELSLERKRVEPGSMAAALQAQRAIAQAGRSRSARLGI